MTRTESEQCHTYLWQEAWGRNQYRFKSTDPRIIRKMVRRVDFTEDSIYLNRPDRVFISRFYSPQEARRTFRRLTGLPGEPTEDVCGLKAITGAEEAEEKAA